MSTGCFTFEKNSIRSAFHSPQLINQSSKNWLLSSQRILQSGAAGTLKDCMGALYIAFVDVVHHSHQSAHTPATV